MWFQISGRFAVCRSFRCQCGRVPRVGEAARSPVLDRGRLARRAPEEDEEPCDVSTSDRGGRVTVKRADDGGIGTAERGLSGGRS